MSIGAVTRLRWRLPVHRQRFLAVTLPAIVVVAVITSALFPDHAASLVTIATTIACVVWLVGAASARLTDTPGPPDPPRLVATRAERRHLRQLLHRRGAVDRYEASLVRPLAEQTGRDAARVVLTSPGTTGFFLLSGFNALPDWFGWVGLAVALYVVCYVIFLARLRRACSTFLDQF